MKDIQNFVTSFDAAWQWLAVMAVGAIPYFESYFGAAIGVVVGVNPAVAITAAIIGNVVSMVIFVVMGEKVYGLHMKKSGKVSSRDTKFKKLFDKFGIAGVSLLGQTLLPSQITSAALVGSGAPKEKVIFWQIISIIIWGVLFGVLASIGVSLIN